VSRDKLFSLVTATGSTLTAVTFAAIEAKRGFVVIRDITGMSWLPCAQISALHPLRASA
jgi:hypothetical protein